MHSKEAFEISLSSMKAFMQENSYLYNGVKTQTSEIGGDETYEAAFRNNAYGISVYISFAPANERFHDYLTVALENDEGDSFLLSDYFSKYNVYQQSDPFLLLNYPGTLAEKLNSCFGFIREALVSNAANVFCKGQWETIDFDWNGYK